MNGWHPVAADWRGAVLGELKAAVRLRDRMTIGPSHDGVYFFAGIAALTIGVGTVNYAVRRRAEYAGRTAYMAEGPRGRAIRSYDTYRVTTTGRERITILGRPYDGRLP